MTTNNEHFDFFPNALQKGIDTLSNPMLAVRRDIVKGEVAGKMDLQHALFPPRRIHRNDVPLTVRFTMEDWITFELHLMVMMYGDVMDGSFSLMGIISHDHQQSLQAQVVFPSDYTPKFIGINYNPVIRQGKIFIPKDIYGVLEILMSADLLDVRRKCMLKSGARLTSD